MHSSISEGGTFICHAASLSTIFGISFLICYSRHVLIDIFINIKGRVFVPVISRSLARLVHFLFQIAQECPKRDNSIGLVKISTCKPFTGNWEFNESP